MEPFYPEDSILDVDVDPRFTKYVLSRLNTALRTNLPIKRTAIPLGLVRCMFRGSFSLNFRGKNLEKILKMILDRIAANKKIGNYGKNTSLMGGISKTCVAHYRAIPPVSLVNLQMEGTYFILKNTVPAPMRSDLIFTNFDPSRPILFDHLPVFVHLLKRLVVDLQIAIQVNLNRQRYTDDCCDCPASYCNEDSFFDLEMIDCCFLLDQISTSLEGYESQLRGYPYSRLLKQRPMWHKHIALPTEL
jgi:hypothetical protein